MGQPVMLLFGKNSAASVRNRDSALALVTVIFAFRDGPLDMLRRRQRADRETQHSAESDFSKNSLQRDERRISW